MRDTLLLNEVRRLIKGNRAAFLCFVISALLLAAAIILSALFSNEYESQTRDLTDSQGLLAEYESRRQELDTRIGILVADADNIRRSLMSLEDGPERDRVVDGLSELDFEISVYQAESSGLQTDIRALSAEIAIRSSAVSDLYPYVLIYRISYGASGFFIALALGQILISYLRRGSERGSSLDYLFGAFDGQGRILDFVGDEDPKETIAFLQATRWAHYEELRAFEDRTGRRANLTLVVGVIFALIGLVPLIVGNLDLIAVADNSDDPIVNIGERISLSAVVEIIAFFFLRLSVRETAAIREAAIRYEANDRRLVHTILVFTSQKPQDEIPLGDPAAPPVQTGPIVNNQEAEGFAKAFSEFAKSIRPSGSPAG